MGELQERYALRKQKLRRLLAEAAAFRNNALEALVKANSLTRHLTGHQRQVTGLTYHVSEIRLRIKQSPPAIPGGEGDVLPVPSAVGCRTLRELKQRELAMIAVIDGIRKKLLELDLLELRCRELMLATSKALQAFHYESGCVRRTLYPFGVFSRLRRSLRSLWGSAYFTLRDMESLAALGVMTGHLLAITDSPAW